MFGFGMQELLVILAIVLLIFGPKRLKNIGADLGNAIKVSARRYLMRVKRQKTMTLQQKSLTAMVRPPRPPHSPPPRPTKKRNKSAAPPWGGISNFAVHSESVTPHV